MCRLEGGLVRSPGWTGECRTFADPCRRVGLSQGLSEASGSFPWGRQAVRNGERAEIRQKVQGRAAEAAWQPQALVLVRL